MEATHRGGLTGKARNIRHRRRVERIQAQQMLEEYLTEEENQFETRSRHVPVRGRAEFLPTIDSWTREDEMFETGGQLELTLQAEAVETACETDQVSKFHPVESEPSEAATASNIDEGKQHIVKVIPSPYWARPRTSFQPQGGRGVARTFDPRRFAYGCAMGTAAAAAILLMASVVFH
jgi:hypothetical protein